MSDIETKNNNGYDRESDETSISIGLNKTGERGSGYRTRNDPSAPFQRATVTERRGIIQVRCKSREVIHGGLSPDSEDNATLLVYDLHLDTTRKSRRILAATLEFEFRSSVPGTPAPEEESLTRGAEVNAGVSQFAEVGGTVKWEKTVRRTTSDDARVTGHIFSDDYGKGVGASWVLHENSSIQSGTPSFMRCAILLNRKYDEGNFECKITIKAEADWKSEMDKLFGSTPKDDPILFDSTLPPTNKLRKEYDIENLGAIDLDDFVEIVFDKTLKKKVKDAT
ncbi:hypothetical protein ACHAPT_013403 [Fusarium lateritium]